MHKLLARHTLIDSFPQNGCEVSSHYHHKVSNLAFAFYVATPRCALRVIRKTVVSVVSHGLDKEKSFHVVCQYQSLRLLAVLCTNSPLVDIFRPSLYWEYRAAERTHRGQVKYSVLSLRRLDHPPVDLLILPRSVHVCCQESTTAAYQVLPFY